MRIELKKFGDILTSRPAGTEAALALKTYLNPNPDEKIELDFAGVLAMSPGWLDEVLHALKEQFGAEGIVFLPSDNASVRLSLEAIEEQRVHQKKP